MSRSDQILLLGLQSTGKTSFLAALWYMVNQTDVDCRLVLEKHCGNTKYLNQIRTAWLEYKPVPRNSVDSEELVSMALKDRITEHQIGLTLPDLSGESFKLQWTKRQLTTRYNELLQNTSAAVLFVHPEQIVKPHRVDSVNELMKLAIAESVGRPSPSRGISATRPWDPEESPTQVQLVELLQTIASREYFEPPFQVAIIVSAWDLVERLGMEPTQYLSQMLPLFRQFLDSNSDTFKVRAYGISAQGGRYASPVFTAAHFTDAPNLIKKLVGKRDPVSTWVWDRFDQNEQSAVTNSPKEACNALVQGFNRLISQPGLYEQDRFNEIELRAETARALEKVRLRNLQAGFEIIRLNRMLLEDAYSVELSKDWQHAKEHSALQSRLPARRVTVVGPEVKDEHDITEPILWLMQ